MTRVKISFGILCILIGLSVFSGIWVNRRCEAMLNGISRIERLAEEGDNVSAAELARELSAQWESFSSGAAVLIKYDKLTEIGAVFAKIDYLAESGSDDLTEELRELGHMLELLRRSETPVLNSVL